MINKALVKKRFTKSLKSYDNNAIVQKITAQNIINFLPSKSYAKILEIGCATGVLTREIKNNISFKEFYANDIVEEALPYIKEIIPDHVFIAGDIETTELKNKYDLIISNAALQWCNNISNTIDKLMQRLNKNGVMAISIFGDDNLFELKKIFNIENNLCKINEIKEYIKKYEVIKFQTEIRTLYFNNLKQILEHIKKTGVNAVTEVTITKSKLEEAGKEYNKLYKTEQGLSLTYTPVYIILKNHG